MILIVVFVVCDVSKSFCLYWVSEKRPLKSQAGNADYLYDKILNILFLEVFTGMKKQTP